MPDLRTILELESDRPRPPLPDLGRIRLRAAARSRRKRAAAALTAVAITAVGALAMAQLARRPDLPRPRVAATPPAVTMDPALRTAEARWVEGQPSEPSDYVFEDIGVTHTPPRDAEDFEASPVVAFVTYRSYWSGDTAPGVRKCTWTVFGKAGEVVGARRSLYEAAGAFPQRNWVDVEVRTEAATATIACSGKRLDDPAGRYVFSEGRWIDDSTLVYRTRWKGGRHAGVAHCIASAFEAGGTEVARDVFTLGVEQPSDVEIAFSRGRPELAVRALLTCEPLTKAHQEP